MPGQVPQIAGAYRHLQYGVFHRFIMRRIILTKDPAADPAADREYTDWTALDAVTLDWLNRGIDAPAS